VTLSPWFTGSKVYTIEKDYISGILSTSIEYYAILSSVHEM
jgi:hypothetical protein